MMQLGRDAVLGGAEMSGLVAALRTGFAAGGTVPARVHLPIGEASNAKDTLLLMPAWADDWLGVKVASVHPGNASAGLATVMATYLLMRRSTGELRAIIDGGALTAVRTAAVSALAADLLASPDARRLAMIGTGALAPHLVRAHRAVRPIDEVRCVGRSVEKADALAASLRAEGIAAVAVTDVTDAVCGADIVCCATTSAEPLICANMLKPGAHIDLVGGFRADAREADETVFADAVVVIDSPTAIAECGDLIVPIERGIIGRADVLLLADLVRSGRRAERGSASRTVFKSVGTALADLIAARHVMKRNEEPTS